MIIKIKDKSHKIKVEEKKNNLCERLFEFADFVNKVRISLREMRESNYWLRIIKRTVKEINITDLDYLIKESHELKSILGSIVQKTR